MAIRNYIPVDVNDLEESFSYDLDGQEFNFTFKYNSEADYFTCTIADSDDNVLVTDEKLVLNVPLFANNTDVRLPTTPLVPIDESGQAKRVSITNFGDTVQLYEDTIPDDYSLADSTGADQDWSDGGD